MNGKKFSGGVITENLMRKFRLVLSYDDPYLIYLFVNILMRPHFFGNLDDDVNNIRLVFNFLTQFLIPKAFSFFHQFHQFPDEYLCGSSCFRTSDFHYGKNS